MNSAGDFAGAEVDSPWVMTGSYFAVRSYSDDVERDGLRMTFTSVHRPLEVFLTRGALDCICRRWCCHGGLVPFVVFGPLQLAEKLPPRPIPCEGVQAQVGGDLDQPRGRLLDRSR